MTATRPRVGSATLTIVVSRLMAKAAVRTVARIAILVRVVCSTSVVLLSGMGSDGVAAMLELRQAGALTLVQDEASSAVWGMPRAAIERDAAELVLSPAEMAAVLGRLAADDRP